MSGSRDELIRLTASEAVARLKRGDITPLDLIDAAERRIAEVEPAVNALPTLCLDRARDHARRLMRGEGREAEGEAGWLAGLPVAIKDLTDVAGVRTTYGSPIFGDHVPASVASRWSSASSARAASSSPSPTRRSSAPAAAPSTRCSAARAIPGTPR